MLATIYSFEPIKYDFMPKAKKKPAAKTAIKRVIRQEVYYPQEFYQPATTYYGGGFYGGGCSSGG